ncbi:hypothetical protein chiPu_0022244 [Chiloscyllium punctatum]|uniref:TATA box binding protein associated factor (TAF) histone-like fold domain-containing protein n=1 Tax=Chiloscyllium punctatum TaxID=137246 RepID=A0A401RFN2_CHIPU|nr:hypothetical protein [Chiloscyllium punctatum]
MSERDERRYVELSKESVKLMGESVGLELGDEVSALLAEDVCYRLRETAQNSTQFMRHAKRRRLTVEDFNRALRWANVEVGVGGPGCFREHGEVGGAQCRTPSALTLRQCPLPQR